MYDTLLVLHILGAVTWVGGGLTVHLLYARLRRVEAPLGAFFDALEWVGMRFYLGSSIVLIATGLGLVAEGDWSWGAWLVFGLVVWAASFLSGAFYLGPETGRIGKLIEERGENDSEVLSRRERLLTVGRVELFLLVLVVIAMAAKPGA